LPVGTKPLPDLRKLSRARDWRTFIALLALADALGIVASFFVAEQLATRPPVGDSANPGIQVLLVFPLMMVILLSQGLYDPQNLLGGTREYAAVFRSSAYSVVAIIVLGFLLHRPISRQWVLYFWGVSLVLLESARFGARRIAYRLRRRGHFITRLIIVGADADAVAVASQLSAPGSGVEVLGFLDDYIPPGSRIVGSLSVLGTPAELRRVAARTGADEAILVPHALPWETLQEVMGTADDAPGGVRIHLSAGFYGLLISTVRLAEHHRVPLLRVSRVRLTPFERAFKRSLDCVLAVALLVGFAPVLLPLMALSRARLGRSVERRTMVGRRGRRFQQYSLAAEIGPTSMFIRKLPGLVNVLRGELSLVGPRAGGQLRPGLTGPWRQADDAREQAVLDLYYIRNYSLWLDLQVLVKRLASHVRATVSSPVGTPAQRIGETRA
jgi:lipopolysaccharide/colanic/teichoic acid biosynthesis glycosyltransferase